MARPTNKIKQLYANNLLTSSKYMESNYADTDNFLGLNGVKCFNGCQNPSCKQ